MNWNTFLESNIGSVFLDQYSTYKESFEPVQPKRSWNVSESTTSFLMTYGWFPGDNGLLPFAVFAPSAGLLEQETPNAKNYGYANVASFDFVEVGIFNSTADTLFSINLVGEARYFARSIPVLVCYGMLELYVTEACFKVKDSGVRDHIPMVLRHWEEAEIIFRQWDPDLWDQGESMIANRFYDISELLGDIQSGNEVW